MRARYLPVMQSVLNNREGSRSCTMDKRVRRIYNMRKRIHNSQEAVKKYYQRRKGPHFSQGQCTLGYTKIAALKYRVKMFYNVHSVSIAWVNGPWRAKTGLTWVYNVCEGFTNYTKCPKGAKMPITGLESVEGTTARGKSSKCTETVYNMRNGSTKCLTFHNMCVQKVFSLYKGPSICMEFSTTSTKKPKKWQCLQRDLFV